MLILAVMGWGKPVPDLIEQARAANHGVTSLTVDELQHMLAVPGRHTVVVVMAAWCAPCIEELPDLVDIYRKYQGEDLNLIGLSIDYAGPQAMDPILKEQGVTFPVFWTGEAAIEAYDIQKIPLVMMVKEGRVVERLVGMRSAKELEAVIVEFMR